MARRFNGRVCDIARSVHSSRSFDQRRLNCLKFEELKRLLARDEDVWAVLRQERRAADMRRSLYHVRQIGRGMPRRPKRERQLAAA